MIRVETKLNLSPKEQYHQYTKNWWTNPECPYNYQYLDLDSMYSREYFGPTTGHPDYNSSHSLYCYMQQVFSSMFGDQFHSVLELGTGGGEITRHFHKAKLDYLAIEGTTEGVKKLIEIGITNIEKHNLKFMPYLNRRFELVMCTEVAEHIEPWFASKVVDNCIKHADVVWFSASDGEPRPHYHHINEAPIHAWDNIFAHMGFPYYVVLNQTASRADRLYYNDIAKHRMEIVGGIPPR